MDTALGVGLYDALPRPFPDVRSVVRVVDAAIVTVNVLRESRVRTTPLNLSPAAALAVTDRTLAVKVLNEVRFLTRRLPDSRAVAAQDAVEADIRIDEFGHFPAAACTERFDAAKDNVDVETTTIRALDMGGTDRVGTERSEFLEEVIAARTLEHESF